MIDHIVRKDPSFPEITRMIVPNEVVAHIIGKGTYCDCNLERPVEILYEDGRLHKSHCDCLSTCGAVTLTYQPMCSIILIQLLPES